MRKLLFSILLISSVVMSPLAKALTLTNESLNYQIVYHWGAIWKHAGDATLSVSKSGNGYKAMLTGKTRSWADKIYTVRDTLKCSMNINFRPLKYEKFTHENSYYAHDVVAFNSSGAGTTAACARYRKGKPTAKINLSHGAAAYDMLSVFYMLRNMDFSKLETNKVYKSCVSQARKRKHFLSSMWALRLFSSEINQDTKLSTSNSPLPPTMVRSRATISMPTSPLVHNEFRCLLLEN